MTDDEITDLVNFLAENPTAGSIISGTGGCRKVRVAGRGKGKSGGYRTITSYSGEGLPVFLLTAFAKGERADLSMAEIAAGLNEALAVMRGEAKPVRLYLPAEIDVKAIRAKLSLSQGVFAARFGFTVNQIRDWEQGRSRPLGGVRAYLLIIERDPERVLDLLQAVGGNRRTRAA